jgi:hypothetical protein
MTKPAYTITTDSITVVINGKTHSVRKGTPNFTNLRKAIIDEDWDSVPQHLSVPMSVQKWAKGKFKVDGSTIEYAGEALPGELSGRIFNMAAKGESPESLFKFWEKLSENPSYRSVNQLWGFLDHQNIAISEDGNILAYKSVRADYKDHHSGEVSNKPGVVNEMPRNKISDDPQVACHEGFHVGSLHYASTFGSGESRLVICEIDPADVVCVPYDASQQKMRVSKYKVVGMHGANLPSTSFNLKADQGKVKKTLKPEHVEKARPKASKFDKLGAEGLLKLSIEDLRKYATKNLSIIGASKIPGGKVALVKKIMSVR